MDIALHRYNPWWEKGYEWPALIVREKSLNGMIASLADKQVVFLTGLRRVGKTSLMRMLIRYLIEGKNIKPSHCFYVSLDDYLLSGYSIPEIIDGFRAIHKLKFQEKIYVFLDEITYKADFELQLKNLHDNQNIKIFASSSSASLLKNRKALLTGRNKVMEILPLDFSEYLLFRNISIKKSDAHLEKAWFEDFLSSGGIPEYVLRGDTEYLRTLVDDIIYKDIAAVHGIKNIQQLKDYFLLLMERAGKVMSIGKVAKILSISPDTSRRYLELFLDSYLIFTVSRRGKTNERLLSPKKIYACDLGVRSLFTGFRDKGSVFENYVYLRLRHLHPEYVKEDNIELDFFTENGFLIEAKYHDEKLDKKQQQLFDSYKAKLKAVLRTENDIHALMQKTPQNQKL